LTKLLKRQEQQAASQVIQKQEAASQVIQEQEANTQKRHIKRITYDDEENSN
jgi:hypothetical protein